MFYEVRERFHLSSVVLIQLDWQQAFNGRQWPNVKAKYRQSQGSKQCHLRPEPDLMIKAGPWKAHGHVSECWPPSAPPSLGAEPLLGVALCGCLVLTAAAESRSLNQKAPSAAGRTWGDQPAWEPPGRMVHQDWAAPLLICGQPVMARAVTGSHTAIKSPPLSYWLWDLK